MRIFIYSDESGTFDRVHNDFFIFAGVICFNKKERDIATRKFSHAEKVLRENHYKGIDIELKACHISNKEKGKLYRSLNQVYKFCVVIKQKNINRKIFEHKKHKQRYLDYAYKIVIKKCLELIVQNYYIRPREVDDMEFNVDEHTTATNGKYELREGLLSEFKYGTFNLTYEKHFKPVFPRLNRIEVNFCNSKNNYLVRASDIISNHCYHKALTNNGLVDEKNNMFVYYLPLGNIGNTGFEYFKES